MGWQRDPVDELTRRRGVSTAALVREAIDRYLADARPELERRSRSRREIRLGEALAATFGALPQLEVAPRDEWDRAGPPGRH